MARQLTEKEKEVLDRLGSSDVSRRIKQTQQIYREKKEADREYASFLDSKSDDEAERKRLYERKMQAGAAVAAFEQKTKEKRFNTRASRMTLSRFEQEFSDIERQKQELEESKGSLWDALKPGGVTPSEWNKSRKEKNAQIKELESKAGKYRTVYDEKKSREMTDRLPDDVKGLLDSYNALDTSNKSIDLVGMFTPADRKSHAQINSQKLGNEQKRQAIAEELKKRGYDNYEELAEYRKYITESEETDKFTEEMGEFTEKHPVISSAANLGLLPARIISGAVGHLEAFDNKTDLKNNPKSSYYALTRANKEKKETIGESFEDGVLSADFKRFLYNTADSAVESLTASALFGAAGDAMLGLGAMNESVIDSLEKGATNTETLVNGIAAGAFEAIFESVSLGNIGALKDIPVKTIKDAIKNIGASIAVNFSEEANTELANLIFDTLYNGGTSQYYEAVTALMGQGYSEKEARSRVIKDMAKQVGLAGLGGALMGGAFGAYGSAAGKVNYENQLTEYGRELTESGEIDKVIAGAKDVQGNDKLHALAEEIVFNEQQQRKAELGGKITALEEEISGITDKKTLREKKKELSNLQKEEKKVISRKDYRNVGKAYELLSEQTDADGDSMIIKAVTERLQKVGVTENTDAVASAILKKARGGRLSKKEQRAFDSSKKSLQVLRELTGEGYKLAWSEKLGDDIEELYDRRYNGKVSQTTVAAASTGKEVKADEAEEKVERYKQELKSKLIREGQNEESFNADFELCWEYGRTGGYTVQDVVTSKYISDSFTAEQKKHAFEAGVYQGLKDAANVRYKGDAVTVFINGYDSKVNRKSYADAFDVFYSEGAHSKKNFDEVLKNNGSLLKFIDEDVAKKAFEAGRSATKAKKDSSLEKKAVKKPAGKGEYSSKTIDEKEMDIFFESVAKKLGVDIKRVQSLTGTKGRRANAYIDLYKGEIVTSASSDNEYQSTIHEIVHYAYAYNSQKMREIAKAVKEYYLSKHGATKLEDTLRSYEQNYEGDRAAAEEEFIADCIAGMFSTNEGVNDFLSWLEKDSGYNAEEKKTILQKLADWVLEIIDAIQELLQGGNLNVVVAELAKEETSRFKEIRGMFLEALDEVAEGTVGRETKNTAEGGVKMSLSEMDSQYFVTVENGDIEKAQKMVDEAAKAKGYNSPLLYHGTHSFGFTSFDLDKMDDKRSIFLTSNEKIASTYSGVTGTKNIDNGKSLNAADMSAGEIVKALNEYDAKHKEGTTEGPHKYELYDYGKTNKLINNVNEGIEKLKTTVNNEIKNYAEKMAVDFDEKDAKIHRQLVSLEERLDRYDYHNLSTPIYLLLHHTDVFKGSAEIAELEKNIRLMNQVRTKDLSAGVVVNEALGGYVIEVMEVDQAREYLDNRLKAGNYSLYAKLGKSLIIDGKGALWKDIRNWSAALEVKASDVDIIKKGDFYELVDSNTQDIIEGGSFAVNTYTDELYQNNKARLRALMVSNANSILRINTETLNTTRDIAKYAKEHGYDSVLFKNILDNGGWNSEVDYDELADIYVIFDESAVKSADAVTYDENGKVIPLSERFKDDNEDIRFSYKASSNKSLTSGSKKRYNKFEEIKLNDQEYSMVSTAVMSYNTRLGKQEELKSIIGVNAYDNYYICVNDELGKFKVIAKYDSEKEVEIIKFIREVLKNEINSISEFASLYAESDVKKWGDNRRRNNLRISDTEDRREGEGNGRLYVQESEHNEFGNFGEGTGDTREIKPSLDWIDFAEEKAKERSLASKVTELEGIVEELRSKIQHPGVKHTVSQLGVQKVARELKKGYLSKINFHVLSEELGTFYGYLANENGLNWDNVKIHLESIATKILDESKYKNPDISEYSKEILREIRSVKIKLNDEQKAEVAKRYGSYNEFRKRMMGTIVLSEEGTSLDSRWQSLSEDYPIFESDIADTNQPLKLVEVVETLRQTYEDPYGMDYDSAKDMLMAEIYEQYFEVPETKYISEEYQLKLARAKAEYGEKIREAKAEFRRQKEEAYKKAKAEYGETLKGLRQEQQEEILKAKARYNLRAQNIADTRIKEKKRNNIIRNVKRLDKLLRNPGKGAPSAGTNKYGKDYVHLTNIPQEFRKAVIDFCSIFIENDAGVFSGVVKSDNVTVREKKVEHLQKIYAMMQNSESYLSETVAEEMQKRIDDVAKIMAERRLAQLSIEELDKVIEITEYLTASINSQVAVWVEGKKSTVEKEGKNAIEQFNEKGKRSYIGGKLYHVAKELGVNNYKPVYFFERVGGVLEKLFLTIQNDGQRAYARNINAAAAFMEGISKKYDYEKWQNEKELVLTTKQGHKLKLTKAQAMHIWATAEREKKAGKDAMHLMQGGIVFDGEIEADTVEEKDKKTGKKIAKLTKKVFKYKTEDGSAHRIHFEDVAEIENYLTEEQKAFVNECIRYLSVDMAALGNEISMELYGIKRFNEQYYIPYNSAKNFIYRKMGENGNAMLKSKSFTKETVFGANNPLVVGDFLEVITKHIEEMSMYNAMVLPLENFNRVWNYQTIAPEDDEKTSRKSVKSALQTAFGIEYVEYIDQLLEDINGGINSDAREKALVKLTSGFKKAAVLGSASVVIQQPSAVVRAFAEIDPKYFVTTTFKGRKKAWENALKYSSTALLKDIGGFDTVSGQSTVDYLTKTEYKGKDKALKLLTDSQYRDDVLAWGPAFADKVTWAHIWSACEKEVKTNNRGLSGEELNIAIGKRFDEVINKTQVYDSVLTRSANMRSKSSLLQMATSFMAEPTTQANMLASAAFDLKNGERKKGVRKVSSVVLSQLFNAVLVSAIYAARDDEEDKTLIEKYLSEVTNNFLGSLDPLTLIPIYKDIVSIFEGYDVKRTDMSLIGKIADAIKALKSTTKTRGEKFSLIAGSVSDALGFPLTNLIRDGLAVRNVIRSAGSVTDTTGKGILYAIQDDILPIAQNLKWYKPDGKDERLYYAFRDGDEKMYNRFAQQYKNGGAVKSALKGQIEESFLEGELTDEEATAQLRRLGYNENEAYYEIRKLKEPVDEEESEDSNAAFLNFEDMQGVQAEADRELEAKRQKAENEDKDFSEDADYTWLHDKLKAGDKEGIREEIELLKEKGVSDSKIQASVKTWLKENDSDVKSQAEKSIKGDYSSYESSVKRIAEKYGIDDSTAASAVRSAAGSNSDPIEGTIYAYGDLHFAIDEGSEQTVSYISKKIFEAKLRSKLNEGEAYDKAYSSVRSGIRSSLKGKWKQAYVSSDSSTKTKIRIKLWATGMYDNSSKLYDTLNDWLHDG